MEERMRKVLAWLRFLAWGVFYAILMGAIVTGSILVFCLPGISYWLWGTPWPGIVAFAVLLFLAAGIAKAGIDGKAPK